MNSPLKTPLPFRWRRRLYLIGSLLCVCMLAALGLWIFFLMPPETTPDGWLAETAPLEDERAGYSGSRAHIAPAFPSNGTPHNEGSRPSENTVDTLVSEPAAVAPATRPQRAPAPPAVASASPEPARARQAARTPVPPSDAQARPVLAESGMAEITITALMPGARVNVADYVVTEAPTTLRVPWPANYTMAVHVDEATVYETKLYLSAENNRVSFAVNFETAPVADVD